MSKISKTEITIKKRSARLRRRILPDSLHGRLIMILKKATSKLLLQIKIKIIATI